MPTRRKVERGQTGKKAGDEKAERKFKIAMLNLEKTAQERMLTAKDPCSAGVKMAKEIRKLAERIEGEVESATTSSTEAACSGYDIIGVGVSVS
jgi:hypothetical protein